MTKPIYTEMTNPSNEIFIKAEYDNGIVYLIPANPNNSDYQAYLLSLEAKPTK